MTNIALNAFTLSSIITNHIADLGGLEKVMRYKAFRVVLRNRMEEHRWLYDHIRAHRPLDQNDPAFHPCVYAVADWQHFYGAGHTTGLVA